MIYPAAAVVFLFSCLELYKILFLDSLRPQCVCGACGWEGNEFELEAYATDNPGEKFIYCCPECNRQKIIFTPQK